MNEATAVIAIQRRLRVALLERSEAKLFALSSAESDFGEFDESGFSKQLFGVLPRLSPFIERIENLLALLSVNKLLLSARNVIVREYFKLYFPALLAVLNSEGFSLKRFLGLRAVRGRFAAGILQTLAALRSNGNAFFDAGEPASAVAVYSPVLFYLRLARRRLWASDTRLLVPRRAYLSILNLGFVLLANASQCRLNLKEFDAAIAAGAAGISLRAELLAIDPTAAAAIERIGEKLLRRCQVAIRFLNPRFAWRYSRHSYPNLRLGSVLESGPAIGDGIFERAMVVITFIAREEGIEGVVFNKKMGGFEDVWLGGPCEPESAFLLHSDSTAPGAREVLPGLYYGGRPRSEGSARVRRYMGKAGWFWGQLDGELFDRAWILRNDLSGADILEWTAETNES